MVAHTTIKRRDRAVFVRSHFARNRSVVYNVARDFDPILET
jgi:hypothetical protein